MILTYSLHLTPDKHYILTLTIFFTRQNKQHLIDKREFIQWYSGVRMTSFSSYWNSFPSFVFNEFMHRHCRVRRIYSMSRLLSNIAPLNIFDSAFHFSISRANRDAKTFHFEFDLAFHWRGKVPEHRS